MSINSGHIKCLTMKTIFLFLLSILATACTTTKNSGNATITGRWQLTHFYADIGDGKENWQPADTKQPRTIEFMGDSSYSDSGNKNLSKYILWDSTHIALMSRNNTDTVFMTIVELKKEELILRPNCIEGCGEKYKRIK